ncbi:MAG: hypothetical protein MJ137_00695 [Clostridia bacterium]|nr:hypothetical protein [Clostridia bacterium]
MNNCKSNKGLRILLCLISAVLFLIPVLSIGTFAEKLDEIPLGNAASVYIYNLDNSVILTSKDSDKRIYPASTVKIMTGLICCENLNGRQKEKVRVTEKMVSFIEGRYMGIKAGDTPTIGDLLYLGFCGGFNDAIVIMEYLIAGSESDFVALMNNRAASLGMKNTHYTNATGVHNDNMYTTAEDTAILAKAAYSNGLLMTVTSALDYATSGFAKTFAFDNYNSLISNSRYHNPLCRGLNAGSTPAAGACAVTVAEKNGVSVLSVVMGAKIDDYNNNYAYILTSRLIDWAFDCFGYIDVFSTSDVICEVPLSLALDTDSVIAVPERKVSYYLPKSITVSKTPGENTSADITYSYRLTEPTLEAPVEKGRQIGFLSVFYRGELIDTVAIVAGTSVDQSRLLYVFDKIREFSKSDFFIGAVITFAVCGILYIVAVSVIKGKRSSQRRRRRR